ncbi:ABC transporter ATP-binding protein [Zhongshania aliphaticivorans]|uniref:ABC transporter ATP-binding protein n=1 Tax=Zhongshania aliphaticivorans TaxID=1470434 RepID=UPI0012E4932A|nr:ABC transporter ATP-binding protein [Zhongshania aliphaticivorans]CAA0078592.1 putative ABC transporter ATP-binding protein YadG [Zhongshania aliphaticivorans]
MAIALQIKGLRKVYDNGFEALKGIDLEVTEGDFFALLGPNGAGKSTTIGIVSSLVKKTAGDVHVFGHSIQTDLAAAKREIGVVPQEFNFSNFETVWDIVVNQAGYYGLNRAVAGERAEKYLKKLGLWDKRDVASRMLSGGMKRRLMIARALIHEPRLLILDEPTAGVDIELRRSMWEFLTEINRSGTTIILTTHYLEEAESLCRHIAIIDGGNIVENTSMKALLRQLQKEVFILDTPEVITPDLVVEGFDTRYIDEHMFELVLKKGSSLNEVFAALNKQGLVISSMRNKANRLEELFVGLLNAK